MLLTGGLQRSKNSDGAKQFFLCYRRLPRSYFWLSWWIRHILPLRVGTSSTTGFLYRFDSKEEPYLSHSGGVLEKRVFAYLSLFLILISLPTSRYSPPVLIYAPRFLSQIKQA